MIAGAKSMLDQPVAFQAEVSGGMIGIFVGVTEQGFDGEVACFHNTPCVSKTTFLRNGTDGAVPSKVRPDVRGRMGAIGLSQLRR